MTGETRRGLMLFAAIAVGVVGLTGVFATYATPLPLERAMAREVALDAALGTPAAADPQAALAALAPRLDDSAPALAGPPAGLADRVARERLAMRARFSEQAASIAAQIRLLIIVITAMAAVFVVAMVGSRARS